jgi:hypothetical protein
MQEAYRWYWDMFRGRNAVEMRFKGGKKERTLKLEIKEQVAEESS